MCEAGCSDLRPRSHIKCGKEQRAGAGVPSRQGGRGGGDSHGGTAVPWAQLPLFCRCRGGREARGDERLRIPVPGTGLVSKQFFPSIEDVGGFVACKSEALITLAGCQLQHQFLPPALMLPKTLPQPPPCWSPHPAAPLGSPSGGVRAAPVAQTPALSYRQPKEGPFSSSLEALGSGGGCWRCCDYLPGCAAFRNEANSHSDELENHRITEW